MSIEEPVVGHEAEDVSGQAVDPPSPLRYAGMHPVTESWYAWRASRRLLKAYRSVRKQAPQLVGKALYEEILVRHFAMDLKAAVMIVRGAEQSFCDWPSGRAVHFRDVVRYLVTVDYLRSHVAFGGTRTNMGRTVARVIPEEL